MFKVWFISPESTAVNQPAYPYASYSTQAGDPVTNLYPVGNYPTQYSTGTNPQPQYQHSFQPPPQPALYEEPEKVPSSPPPSYDQVNYWLATRIICVLDDWMSYLRMFNKWISQNATELEFVPLFHYFLLTCFIMFNC